MKVLVTGATGFLGSQASALFEKKGHEVVRLGRPRGAERSGVPPAHVLCDAGDPAVRDLIAGCDAVLHFAGVPDPARAREDPARAVRENAGTTLNLLEGCAEAGAGLVYPSTLRAALDPPPDPYAHSKRLGEEACRLHRAPTLVVRLPSVYGPGQVASEGATGAIASFAARALADEPIVIVGDPERSRDFVYVEDALGAIEALVAGERWNETALIVTGRSTPLRVAAELVRDAAGSSIPIETPGGDLPAGENESYRGAPEAQLPLNMPLEEGVRRYVDWLRHAPRNDAK
ncbi:MAG TPA: NAD-dependent epimerase/dehydratase family protein [Gaiellaceae bacterium]